jgi:hypothetical protein
MEKERAKREIEDKQREWKRVDRCRRSELVGKIRITLPY